MYKNAYMYKKFPVAPEKAFRLKSPLSHHSLTSNDSLLLFSIHFNGVRHTRFKNWSEWQFFNRF